MLIHEITLTAYSVHTLYKNAVKVQELIFKVRGVRFPQQCKFVCQGAVYYIRGCKFTSVLNHSKMHPADEVILDRRIFKR